MADERISLQQAASGGNLVFVAACACDRPGFIAGCDFVLSSAFGFGFVLEKPFFPPFTSSLNPVVCIWWRTVRTGSNSV